MGKNHRHKKKLKSEKAKTHITTKTKFLPKGQNVTNTTFKIKPIIIQEQLKDKSSDVGVTRKKKNINELIPKLKHHNDTMKIEACEDLSDMLQHFPVDEFQVYLSQIIQHTSQLIQNRDKKVRKACVKLINHLLHKVDSSKIDTFFMYISANLRCAMTNIDRNIQEDSLLILDSLLEYVPSLIAKHFDKIFPDFLTLISKLRHNSSSERTLTLNLGSKLTSVRWRIKVLSRLYGILDSMMNNRNAAENTTKNDVNVNVKFNENLYFIPLYKNMQVIDEDWSDLFSDYQNVDNKNNILDVHIKSLVPLLYETWLEVVPEKSLKKSANDSTVLNEESTAILCCIVKILYLLHQYAGNDNMEKIFSTKETEQFFDYLLLNFPYNQNKRHNQETITKDVSKVFVTHNDPKCIEENLLISYLFISLKITNSSKIFRNKLNKVISYINRCLQNCKNITLNNLKILLNILQDILVEHSKFWRKFGVNHVEILENCLTGYEVLPNNMKSEMLKILTSTLFTFKSDKYENWLKELPKQLHNREIFTDIVNVLLTLTRENCEAIHIGLLENFKEVLDILPKYKDIDDDIQIKFSYIFLYLPLNNNHVEDIENFCNKYNNLTCSQLMKKVLEWRIKLNR